MAAWTTIVLIVTLIAHRTPLYFVETDLIGEYIPAARDLAHGVVASHYSFKGPGYPALLALFGIPCAGDYFLAARLLSALAAGFSAWLGFRLVRAAAQPAVAALALAVMLASPVLLRYAIEAGTDAPALALMLLATLLVVRTRTPWDALLSGLVAGIAVLTRGNAAFLVAAGLPILTFRAAPGRNLAAYAAGYAAPLAVWALACAQASVVIHDRNYLNVAYEFYGRDLTWNEFENTIGARFGSLFQVLAFDPLRAAGRIAWNLVAHRTHDLREIVPPWLGITALAGLVPLARDRAWRPALLHAGLCAVALAAVFYNARFGLYLLPIYAAAAAVTMVHAHAWLADRLPVLAIAARAAVAGLVVASAARAAISVGGSLAVAPYEVRRAAVELERLGAAGSRGAEGPGIVARKPHVAYFARMTYVPMPAAGSLFELLNQARAEHAEWVFFSRVERATRPEYAVLADSAIRLPGLEPKVYHGALNHEYAIYRLAPQVPDSGAFAVALGREVEGYATRHPGDQDAQVFAALQLNELGRHQSALACLDALRRLGHDDARAEQLRADACLALGRLDSAATACVRSLALAEPLASRWARLGEIRARQGRFDDAAHAYERAVALEPGQVAYLERLGLANITLKRYGAAADAFDRCVLLAPRDVRLRRYAIGAWQLAGDVPRMRERYQEGIRLGIAPARLTGAPGPSL